MGRSGRDVLSAVLPELRRKLQIDFVLVNGENAAGGFGITADICQSFYQLGTDVITLGNHAWDQRETMSYIEADPKLIRPANYPIGTPGRGSGVYKTSDGQTVLVIQVMCRLFMDAIDDPFASLKSILDSYRLGTSVDAILVDIHGEATSEKQALARYVDGQISVAAGTHTHVPTADHMIFPGGTAFITDLGMCGAYNSIIGMEIKPILHRFTRKMPGERFSPVLEEATLCAVYVETNDSTGLATHISPVRIGGILDPVEPNL